MKIARFSANGSVSCGVIDGDVVKAIHGPPWEALQETGDVYAIEDVSLLSPVVPPDVFAIGLNYRAHADEQGVPYPSVPVVFLKATSSVIGPGDCILLPAMAPHEVDYEAELAIVIGKTCHRVSEEKALDYVLGYTCGNDVSARDAQLKQDRQWARGKSFDTFCPLGPWIETELDGDNVEVQSILNGRLMQSSNSSDMIFSCAQLVSYISQIVTMRPGTVIISGTPSGVGYAREEPVFLRPGDEIEIRITGIGSLVNCAQAEQ